MTDPDRLVAYIGAYGGENPAAGGITVLAIDQDADTVRLRRTSRTSHPQEAGYLAYAASSGTLYAVDERKTDGRGPVGPTAAVHAFEVDQEDGSLTDLNHLPAPGPFPTYLAVDDRHNRLYCADHGSFEHIEQVVQIGDRWETRYLYDDSTVLQYRLRADGHLDRLEDVAVMKGHGLDPNHSLQAGGHGQSSGHAHSAVLDPTGKYLLVGDKGADRILVFRTGPKLDLASVYRAEPETGPRHIAFDPVTHRAYLTYEFSSELVVFDFQDGTLLPVARCSTTAGDVGRTNEPADVRVHPAGRLVYVNNRGEDTLAWFRIDDDGTPHRVADVHLAASIHPGLAARSFAFTPDGSLLLVADRPAGVVRAYHVDTDGALAVLTEADVPEAAFVTVVALQ